MNALKIIKTGELIPFYSATLSIDKSSHCWTFNAEVADAHSLSKLKPVKSLRGDYVEVEFKLSLAVWRLVIEQVSSDDTGYRYAVVGRSTSVFLTEPYAKPLTKTWMNTSMAAIVAELCAEAGLAVYVDIKDWSIDNYAVTERYPLDIIKDLVGEKKAIISALPDGTVWILPNLPCSPRKINQEIIDYYVATDTNIFSRAATFENRKNYNKVTITKQSDTITDNAPTVSIESEIIGNDAVVKVRVVPFVDNVTLEQSSGNNVSVWYEGVKHESVTDQLIITDGKANLSKPFGSLTNVLWHQSTLNDLAINSHGEVTAGIGFSVLTITYQSPYHQYRVQRLADIDLTGVMVGDLTALTNINAPHLDLILSGTQGDNPMPPIIVKTLTLPADLLDRAQQELWSEMLDIDEYSIECAYDSNPFLPAKIAQVKITKTAELFNAYVKAVSVQIGDTITQSIALERPLL
jgi:hypothetical protein